MSTFDEDEEEFGVPSNNLGPVWKDSKGVLFAMMGLEQVFEMTTSFGKANPMRARIVEVDGPNAGTLYDDALVFPAALVRNLSRNIGKVLVGRVGQGEAQKGQDPPWILIPGTGDEVEVARRAWRASKGGAAKASTSKETPY